MLVNILLGAEMIPEKDDGFSAQDRAQRLLQALTVSEMAVFSFVLSYVFSYQSMQGEPGRSESVVLIKEKSEKKQDEIVRDNLGTSDSEIERANSTYARIYNTSSKFGEDHISVQNHSGMTPSKSSH